MNGERPAPVAQLTVADAVIGYMPADSFSNRLHTEGTEFLKATDLFGVRTEALSSVGAGSYLRSFKD